jgi:hypothetical protein
LVYTSFSFKKKIFCKKLNVSNISNIRKDYRYKRTNISYICSTKSYRLLELENNTTNNILIYLKFYL